MRCFRDVKRNEIKTLNVFEAQANCQIDDKHIKEEFLGGKITMPALTPRLVI